MAKSYSNLLLKLEIQSNLSISFKCCCFDLLQVHFQQFYIDKINNT